MGIKDFQKFDVRGDDADEAPLILSVQFGRSKPAQSPKDLVPQQRQKLECDEMVACLLAVAQQTPQHGKYAETGENHRQGEGRGQPQHIHHGKTAEHGDEGGAQMTGKPCPHRQRHISGQGADQTDQPSHDTKSASFHTAAPFAYCSSSCWALHSRWYVP